MNQKPTLLSRLINMMGMVLVLALSLLLLLYVGYGEAGRTYPKFQMEKLSAQAETLKLSMDPFLLAGLPLEQFPGFVPLSQPLLASDEAIVSVYVTDPQEKVIFYNPQADTALEPGGADTAGDFETSTLEEKDSRFSVTESDTYYRVTLELRSKFQTVGQLHVTLPRSEIDQKINSAFLLVAIAAVAILIVFAVIAFVVSRRPETGRRALNLAYTAAFFVVAILVIMTLINLYTDGIREKTEALASSLGQRLSVPLSMGLDITDFADLDAVLNDYKRLNPDLSFIALTSSDRTLIHTDKTLEGKIWESPSNTYEYTFTLQRSGTFATSEAELHVGVPTSVIFNKLWRSVKNFVVLFAASAFLAYLFFSLMQAFVTKSATTGDTAEAAQRAFQLSLIRPFYFLAVFIEGLNVSFLPQYLEKLARETGANTNLVSTLFTLYFLCFVLALLPSGQYAERRGPKPLLLVGVLMSAVSLVLMAVVDNFYAMFGVRALAGLGQGILFIGVQSYILDMAATGHKTQGAAIIVFGYNGGTISGTAIGALLVIYMGETGVFIIGAVAGAFALLYAASLVQRIHKDETVAPVAETEDTMGLETRMTLTTNQVKVQAKAPSLWQRIGKAIRDFEFVRAMLFIGIPAKAVLTGVTIFALPLLLSRQDYPREDIGQVIMLYAAGVLISSAYVSRLVDRTGKTTLILFAGTLGSGIGLILIGLAGMESASRNVQTLLLIAGMLTLGLAHGFIHAPIVTHIAGTQAAKTLGQSSATSLYRFLERMGHVAGPIIVSQLLLWNHDKLFTISWLGFAMIALGMLFLVGFSRNIVSPRKAPGSAS